MVGNTGSAIAVSPESPSVRGVLVCACVCACILVSVRACALPAPRLAGVLLLFDRRAVDLEPPGFGEGGAPEPQEGPESGPRGAASGAVPRPGRRGVPLDCRVPAVVRVPACARPPGGAVCPAGRAGPPACVQARVPGCARGGPRRAGGPGAAPRALLSPPCPRAGLWMPSVPGQCLPDQPLRRQEVPPGVYCPWPCCGKPPGC